MQRRGGRRTGSDLPGLELAERQAWQHYLDAVLRFDAAMNQLLNDEHQLSVIGHRVLNGGGDGRIQLTYQDPDIQGDRGAPATPGATGGVSRRAAGW